MDTLTQILSSPMMKIFINFIIIHLAHYLLTESFMIFKKLRVDHIWIFFNFLECYLLRLSFGDYFSRLVNIFIDFFANYIEYIVVDLSKFSIKIRRKDLQSIA